MIWSTRPAKPDMDASPEKILSTSSLIRPAARPMVRKKLITLLICRLILILNSPRILVRQINKYILQHSRGFGAADHESRAKRGVDCFELVVQMTQEFDCDNDALDQCQRPEDSE